MKRSPWFLIGCVLGTLGTAPLIDAAQHYYVPTVDYPTIQSAVNAAAGNDGQENYIYLGPDAVITGPTTIGAGFDEQNTLVIRPLPHQPRACIFSGNGAQPVFTIASSHVTLQDLDILRDGTNNANLVNLIHCTEVTIQRCRMGSLKDAVGATGYAVLNIVNPNGVVIRNCMCFAMIRGAFDYGIRASVGSPHSLSLFLYNNDVADYGLAGIYLTGNGDGNVYVLRNNVVVNQPQPAHEPFAYVSAVASDVKVFSSHNTAFASSTRTEYLAVGAQPITGQRISFLRSERGQATAAFRTVTWIVDPIDAPNHDFFRLKDPGALHGSGSDRERGVNVQDGIPTDWDPLALDRGVIDDWEGNPRPSGWPKHTDRGADQVEIDLVLPHDLLLNPAAQVPR